MERINLKKYYNDYLLEIANLVIEYLKQNYKVHLLAFCVYEKDDVAINDLIKLIPKNDHKNIIIDYYTGDINLFLNIISKLDIMIATRFHSIVLGLKYGCKLIPICYSNKSINMLKDIGTKNYTDFADIKNLSNIKYTNINTIKLNQLKNMSKQHFEILD